MTRLTLTVDEEVAREAERLAQERGESVSDLFARYVRTAAKGGEGRDIELGPLTRQATGLLKLPPDKDYREALAEALAEKYGLEE